MKKVINLSRLKAVSLIDDLRAAIADIKDSKTQEKLNVILIDAGIEPFERCDGEAHSNAFIDNCGVCMPRWGWRGSNIKIR